MNNLDLAIQWYEDNIKIAKETLLNPDNYITDLTTKTKGMQRAKELISQLEEAIEILKKENERRKDENTKVSG